MERKRTPSRLRRVAVALAAMLVLLGCCEAGLRLGGEGLDRRLSYEDRTSHGFWNISDHTDLFRNHQRLTARRFAGRRLARHKPAGVKRIVCLGSSSTEGEGASDAETRGYPARLQELLHAAAPGRYQVINGGIGGAPLFMLWVYLDQVLLRWSPDLVLLYFGDNGDKADAWAYFDLMRRELAADPGITSDEQMWAAVRLRYTPPWLVRSFLALCRLRTFMLMVNLADTLQARLPGGHDLAWELRGDSPEDHDQALLARSAEKVVRSSLQAGAKILLLPELRAQDIRRNAEPPYAPLFRRLAGQYRRQGAHFASLKGTFTAGQTNRLMVDDLHMNDTGYLRLAEQILHQASEAGLLPPHAVKEENQETADSVSP